MEQHLGEQAPHRFALEPPLLLKLRSALQEEQAMTKDLFEEVSRHVENHMRAHMYPLYLKHLSE